MPGINGDGDPDDGKGVSGDEVLLVVPAAPEYLRLVRLTAAGLASRMGFTFDEVEDLRIAVDELCHLLVGEGVPGSEMTDGSEMSDNGARTIELRYFAGPDSIGIAGSTAHQGAAPEPNELSLQILTALVDDVTLSNGDGRLGFQLRKQRELI